MQYKPVPMILGAWISTQACPEDAFEADVEMLPVFDSSGLAGFVNTWRVEPSHSQEFLEHYDKNHDKILDAQETAALVKEFRQDFEPVGFFLQVYSGNTKPEASLPTKYDARIEGDRLVIRFEVPYRVAAKDIPSHLVVGLYDPAGLNALSWNVDDAVGAANSVTGSVHVDAFADRVDRLKSFPPMQKPGEQKGLFLRFSRIGT